MADLRKRVVVLVRRTRRCEDMPKSWQRLQHLVEGHLEEIATTFSARWLLSICDSYADHASPIERRNAFAISLFVNMIKFADTSRLMRGPIDPSKLEPLRSPDRPIVFSEMRCIHLGNSDTLLNLSKRMTLLLEETPVLARLFQALLAIVHSTENSVTEFAAVFGMPERVFPADPLDMPDNYGTTRLGCAERETAP